MLFTSFQVIQVVLDWQRQIVIPIECSIKGKGKITINVRKKNIKTLFTQKYAFIAFIL